MLKRILAVAGISALTAAGAVLASGTAHATPLTVTASTYVANNPDSGAGGNNWAYDDYTRTLTITADPSGTACTTGQTEYTASVSDHGVAHTILGVKSPNYPSYPVLITRSVTAAMNGGGSYTVCAPAADVPSTSNVPATVDDNFVGGTGNQTTGNWPKLAFSPQAGVTATLANDWSWTYTRACESWTDAASNGAGGLPADGNITGKVCAPPPHVYDVDVRQGRHHAETVTWHQTSPSADTVTLNGPGYWHDVFSVSPGTDYLVLPRLREHSWYSVTVQAAGGNSVTTWFRTGR
jgi:hypothetical protein